MNINYMTESNFWKYQPIIPKTNQKPYTIIGNIPPFIGTNDTELNIYRFNMKYFDDILNFINDNYISGYRLLPDYLRRKLAITNSHAFVLCDNKHIVGFIYSQPLLPTNINLEPAHYVDLLTILHSHRKKGYANILISAMANFAGKSRVFMHKKDKKPLMFPYFYRSRHYSASIQFLIDKYRYPFGTNNNNSVINTDRAYQIYVQECETFKYKNPIDVFHTSSSVQTHIFRDCAVVSFAIFEFNGNTPIAEIFYVSLEFNNDDYIQLIHILHRLDIQLIVSLPYRFFRTCIEKDSYMESMELFIHSYNMYIPNQTETEIDAIIPFIAF
jgi:hypothetical protein